jgi:hypothetical protein
MTFIIELTWKPNLMKDVFMHVTHREVMANRENILTFEAPYYQLQSSHDKVVRKKV